MIKKILRRRDFGESVIEAFGFEYDETQDIFYSSMDAWQRKFGYCRLYDEAAAPLSMVVDCEPIHFEYEGKKWLIELWKGQYGMLTGAEVGVYTTTGPDLNIPGVFNGTFYERTDDEDHLQISIVLTKNKKTLFARKDRHWWLTGFVLGEFSEPSDLKLKVKITFKDARMRKAFISALKKVGYNDDEYMRENLDVYFLFDKPHSEQPLTRIPITDAAIQKKNQFFCETYRNITGEFENSLTKLEYVRLNDPKLYKTILATGRTKKLYAGYGEIKNHLF